MDASDPVDQSKPDKPESSSGSNIKENGNGVGTEVEAGHSDIQSGKSTKPAIRKRVSQACSICRSRKDKCDGKKPTCSTCAEKGRDCSYDATVKKRGLPEGYVRGIEKLWGLSLREVEGLEGKVLSVLNNSEGSNDWLMSIWRADDELAENWRKSQLAKELERLLPVLDSAPETAKRKRVDSDVQRENRLAQGGVQKSEDLQIESCHSLWPGGYPDDLQIRSTLASGIARNKVGNQDALVDPATISSPGGLLDAVQASPTKSSPDLPSDTWHLLDVYFSYTHSWLPIVEKHDLLRISYQYRDLRDITGASGDLALLWAVIALAKYQLRAIKIEPLAQKEGSVVWTAEEMLAHARSLVPNEDGYLEVSHVQALLLLTLANLGCGHLSRAWSLISQAVALAIDLDIDDSPDMESAEHPKVNSRSTHVFLGCFVLDTIISSRLGRRPHLRSEDVDRLGFLVEDGLEEWDPWNDSLGVQRTPDSSRGPARILSTFNRLIQVLQIMNDASCGSNESQTSRATGLLERLHVWSQAQSEPLYSDSSAINTEAAAQSMLPHQYYLHVAYFSTRATCQLLAHSQRKQSPDLEPCSRSGRAVVDLFQKQYQKFGLLIIPPIFEHYTKTAYDIVHAVRDSIQNLHIVLDWERCLDDCVAIMEPAWPAFKRFGRPTNGLLSCPRRESEVGLDLMNGMSRSGETPQSTQTPASIAWETSSVYTPSSFRPRAMTTSDIGRQSVKRTAMFASYQMQPLGKDNFIRVFESPASTYMDKGITGSSVWSPSQQRQFANDSHTSFDLNQNLRSPNPQGSVTSLPELDPNFNEFATADITKNWTESWDQSLLNLGFPESGNMDQDFYAFCQDPDPLYPNSVFQRLLANPVSDNNSLMNGTVFGGMGFGGFGHMGFSDENEGIEAGQILQALSAAEDQGAAGSTG